VKILLSHPSFLFLASPQSAQLCPRQLHHNKRRTTTHVGDNYKANMASTLGTLCALVVLFPAVTTSIPLIPRYVSENEILAAYDYVVIGGGTSGLTIANRLSEDSSSRLTLPRVSAKHVVVFQELIRNN